MDDCTARFITPIDFLGCSLGKHNPSFLMIIILPVFIEMSTWFASKYFSSSRRQNPYSAISQFFFVRRSGKNPSDIYQTEYGSYSNIHDKYDQYTLSLTHNEDCKGSVL